MDPFAVVMLIVIPIFVVFMLVWAAREDTGDTETRIYNWEDE